MNRNEQGNTSNGLPKIGAIKTRRGNFLVKIGMSIFYMTPEGDRYTSVGDIARKKRNAKSTLPDEREWNSIRTQKGNKLELLENCTGIDIQGKVVTGEILVRRAMALAIQLMKNSEYQYDIYNGAWTEGKLKKIEERKAIQKEADGKVQGRVKQFLKKLSGKAVVNSNGTAPKKSDDGVKNPKEEGFIFGNSVRIVTKGKGAVRI